MTVNLVINMCGECPFLSHSGAFTPGGAKDVCNHANAVETFAGGIEGDDRYHWKHRVVKQYAEPPTACPLRLAPETKP